jgi:hypothetical protein
MTPSNTLQEPMLGYRFEHPESSHAPGGSRFEVYLNENPTETPFDAERLHLHVKSKNSTIESLMVRHPWFFEQKYQVLAGSIELTDRHGEEVEAFTFGGIIKIESLDKVTICILESPAPILKISLDNPILMIFIEEIEILLAERSAALLSKPHEYEKHLINADPFKLYLACLNTLIDKYEHLHYNEGLYIIEFLNFLHGIRNHVKDPGLSPHLVPLLEEIL